MSTPVSVTASGSGPSMIGGTGEDVPVMNRDFGANIPGWWDYNLLNLLASSQDEVTVGDIVLQRSSAGNLNRQVIFDPAGITATFGSSNPAVFTVDASGLLTYVSTGTAQLTITSASRIARKLLKWSDATIELRYKQGITGSLRRHIENNVDACVGGDLELYPVLLYPGFQPPLMSQNSNFWARNYSNFSCVAAYGTNGGNWLGATAISQDILIVAEHTKIGWAGSSFLFPNPTTGELYWATSTGHKTIGNTDVRIVKVSPLLPNYVVPAKLWPANYLTKISNNLEYVPLFRVNQYKQIGLVRDYYYYPDYGVPVTPRADKLLGLIGGDSGHGDFAAINGQLVFDNCHYGRADNIITEINIAVTELGGSDYPQAIDLSGFPNV